MDTPPNPSSLFVNWSFRIAVALACLNLITVVLFPVEGVLSVALCGLFAWGIRRRQAWAAVAASGYQLLPLLKFGLADSWPAEVLVGLIVTVLIHGLLALVFLFGAVGLWSERRSWHAWSWGAVLVVLLVGNVCFRVFAMPTPGMEETLLVGDLVLVETASWRLGRTARDGQIIVFRYPVDRTKAFIKRVVGVPGDRLRVEGKQLHRNGKPVAEDYSVYKRESADRDPFPPKAWSREYDVSEDRQEMLAAHVEDGEVVVPEGNYFVLGDNRDDSLDSRYWGFVPQGDIIGAPLMVYISHESAYDAEGLFARRSILNVRWNRMFKLIF